MTELMGDVREASPLCELTLAISAWSHLGHVRQRNEDMAVVGDALVRDGAHERAVKLATLEHALVVAVADGLGGHLGGAEASRRVAERVREAAPGWPAAWGYERLSGALQAVLSAAHLELLAEGERDATLAGMGTTWTGLVFTREAALLAHVGDSRCYRVRDGVLSLQTRDHTALASVGPGATRTVLTNSVGAGDTVSVDLANLTRRMYSGDQYLVCSDGAADAVVPDAEVLRALESAPGVEGVVHHALERGGSDNITAVRIVVT
ncbi:PP2C family protein-serine/threonine phosphatase [Longimicrobium terrae]|uniref:Serine/threonine protein phosphatase PrpC n=1 Tax=Longimicrobium terrae TaxID=1639882 RepID=A0A841GNZ6_9BACT|nr:protein phosphatase 2C domain-containing protein [Longimicrobium terrae]MBB4635981.1 serine/threonine protein phosphatase PrpC [Longimicrobium terrae]MBB6070377.1 serine/threonine protein phosphatase PrpC [Longimicrobium terrae]NNC30874.1 serine/threonine-protein phosphatase [Longimicrobium terrae]